MRRACFEIKRREHNTHLASPAVAKIGDEAALLFRPSSFSCLFLDSASLEATPISRRPCATAAERAQRKRDGMQPWHSVCGMDCIAACIDTDRKHMNHI